MDPKSLPPALLTVEEAAAYLRLSRSTMYAMIQEGRVKPVRIRQDAPRIRVADLDRLIAES